MAPTPREVFKPISKPKVQTSVLRKSVKSVSSTSNKSSSGVNKELYLKKDNDKIETEMKSNKTKEHLRSAVLKESPQRKVETKENKTIATPGSITKSVKKTRKYMPKPAHSGVPVPDKMRKLFVKASLEHV